VSRCCAGPLKRLATAWAMAPAHPQSSRTRSLPTDLQCDGRASAIDLKHGLECFGDVVLPRVGELIFAVSVWYQDDQYSQRPCKLTYSIKRVGSKKACTRPLCSLVCPRSAITCALRPKVADHAHSRDELVSRVIRCNVRAACLCAALVVMKPNEERASSNYALDVVWSAGLKT
jgi:hypothetical protein